MTNHKKKKAKESVQEWRARMIRSADENQAKRNSISKEEFEQVRDTLINNAQQKPKK